MNKTLAATTSHPQLREFLKLGKALSREKSSENKQSRQARRCSRSPKDHQQERKNETEQYRQLQERYLDLEGKYRDLLEKVKQRGSEHDRLKAEIKNYQKTHERDTLEIERLRCIIGLVKKKSVSIQVEEDQLDFSFPRGSRLNKFDLSTDDETKLRNSGEKVQVVDKISPYKQMTRQREEMWDHKQSSQGIFSRSKLQYNLNHTEKEIAASKYSRQIRESISSNIKLSNSPYSKLRFVPNTTFK